MTATQQVELLYVQLQFWIVVDCNTRTLPIQCYTGHTEFFIWVQHVLNYIILSSVMHEICIVYCNRNDILGAFCMSLILLNDWQEAEVFQSENWIFMKRHSLLYITGLKCLIYIITFARNSCIYTTARVCLIHMVYILNGGPVQVNLHLTCFLKKMLQI